MTNYHRTLMRIVKVDRGMIEFVIPGWNPHLPIRRPVSILPWQYRRTVLIGDHFFADVTLDAQSENDIKFKRLEYVDEIS